VNIPAETDLTLGEVAAIGGISVRTVRRLVKAGELVVLKHNARVHRIPLWSWQDYRQAVENAALSTSRQKVKHLTIGATLDTDMMIHVERP